MVAQNEKNKKKWGQILKLESPKPGSSRELFVPENGIKTCYTVYFSKNSIQIWEAWKSMGDMKFRLDFYLKRPST